MASDLPALPPSRDGLRQPRPQTLRRAASDPPFHLSPRVPVPTAQFLDLTLTPPSWGVVCVCLQGLTSAPCTPHLAAQGLHLPNAALRRDLCLLTPTGKSLQQAWHKHPIQHPGQTSLINQPFSLSPTRPIDRQSLTIDSNWQWKQTYSPSRVSHTLNRVTSAPRRGKLVLEGMPKKSLFLYTKHRHTYGTSTDTQYIHGINLSWGCSN